MSSQSLNDAMQDLITTAAEHGVAMTAVVSTRSHVRACICLPDWSVLRSVPGEEPGDQATFSIRLRGPDADLKERIADTIQVMSVLRNQLSSLSDQVHTLGQKAIGKMREMGVRITTTAASSWGSRDDDSFRD